MAGLDEAIDQLLAAYRAGRPLALLFDYDGTLVPIVDHPAHAKLPAEKRRLLQRLAERPRVVVGILSGRRMHDLKEMVGLHPTLPSAPDGGKGTARGMVCYCGVSGMELELDGMRMTHPEADKSRALIGSLIAPLSELAAGCPGAWVEDKRFGLTLHYRAAPPSRASVLQARAHHFLQYFAEQLRILDVALAMEITPAFGWTKGSAVAKMAAHAGTGALPLYAGDEANDQDALEVANALGGVSIGIGPRAPLAARHLLEDSAALGKRMARILQALELPMSFPTVPGNGTPSSTLAGINLAVPR
jgi:trehalose 6-phosphate phosphatase